MWDVFAFAFASVMAVATGSPWLDREIGAFAYAKISHPFIFITHLIYSCILWGGFG